MWAIGIVSTVFFLTFNLVSYYRIFSVSDIALSLRTISADAVGSIQGYTAYLIFLFLAILICNMLGMVPYTLTITSFSLTTFSLSFTSFLGLNIVALVLHNSKLVDLFLPSGAPLVMS